MVSAETQAKVRAVLRRFQKRELPAYAVDLDYSFGSDWTGDPIVDIVVNLKDEAELLPDLGPRLAELSHKICRRVLDKETEAFPHVDYRTVSEKREQLQASR